MNAEWVRSVLPAAQAAAARIGCDARLLVAQAAAETGWGEHMPRRDDGKGLSNNLFNIKADKSWHGQTAGGRTQEFINGKSVNIQGKFRAYDSIEAGFQGYADFIWGNLRYQKALKVAHDPVRYMLALQDAGYATDPHYSGKVLQIYRQLLGSKEIAA